jgi:hypothetical protein
MKTIKNTANCLVIFDGRKYFGIKEFGYNWISLFTEETLQGTFSTGFAISTVEYRKNHTTRAKIEISDKKDWTVFKIFSDWGGYSKLEIHNSLSKEIESVKKEAIDQNLIKSI